MLQALSKLFSSGVKEVADSTFNGLDKLITSKQEKGEIKISLEELKNELAKAQMNYNIKSKELQFKIVDQEFQDRASARSLGKVDPWTPRILTLIFTLGFFAITGFMLHFLLSRLIQDLDNYTVSFISYVFGAFNAIMIQIISYYFGSSKGGDDQTDKIADSFRQANGNNTP